MPHISIPVTRPCSALHPLRNHLQIGSTIAHIGPLASGTRGAMRLGIQYPADCGAEAGLKTSALVAAGSALFVLMANSFSEPDPIVAQWECWRQCWRWLRIYCCGTYATGFRSGMGARSRLESGHSLPRLL